MEDTSFVIIGAGPIGATAALSFAQQDIPITLIDKREPTKLMVTDFDRRAYALSLSSVRLFQKLGVWDLMEPHAQPINHIWVVEEETKSPLVFNHKEYASDPMGYIVESQWVLRSLYEKMAAQKKINWIQQAHVTEVTQEDYEATVQLDTGQAYKAPLLIAADGRFSALAKETAIPRKQWSYDQVALVAPLAHSLPHDGWAFEIFTPHGPLAILPMHAADAAEKAPIYRSSLVWSVPKTYATFLLDQDEATFADILTKRFGTSLGSFNLAGKRWSYPLSGVMMKRFYEGRLVFAGDATCGIHPVAGQGLNLGLQGVASLVDLTLDALKLGLDPGRDEVLRQYHKAHRLRAATMAVSSHSIVKLFDGKYPFMRQTMGKGLGLVQRARPLRKKIMTYAMGV